MSGRRAIPALLLLAVFVAPGRADGSVHAHPALCACSDPRATGTVAGSIAAPGGGSGRRLVASDLGWPRIGERRGLLVRKVPAVAGEPARFRRPEDLAPAAADKVLVLALIAWLELPVRLLYRRVGRCRPWHRARAAARRRRALVIAGAEIEAQRTRLRVRRLQLVVPDRYGTHDPGRWNREKAYFCRSRIVRSLAAQGLVALWPDIAREVDRRIERVAAVPAAGRCRGRDRRRAGEAFSRFDPRMAPTDYERHCAVLLRRAGWDAELTVATGDQGTDVLARRGRRSLVLQCKLYSKPVGNSAVQQIAAARAHHRADFAAVVSNADFTRRARELAATNGVYLLHHDELADFPPERRHTA